MADAGIDFPLVHASAGEAPFDDETFDIVFSDHGAMTFADPFVTVPEAARLLRPGGLLAFSHLTPLAVASYDDVVGVQTTGLHRTIFGMRRIEWTGSDEPVEFNLPTGRWIELFGAHGMRVESLLEVRPPKGAESTYRTPEETEWARHWPMEEIWRVRKE
jgi:SAM-dependent methyltransferase